MNKFIHALKKYPFSPFVLILFVFVHAYNYAYKWMNVFDLWDVFIYSVVAVITVFILFKKVLKSASRAAIISSLLILVFFYIEFLKDFVMKYAGSYLHLRYTVPVVLIILIYIFYKIRKVNTSVVIRLNYFFNVLFLIYIVIDIGILSFNVFLKPKNKLELMNENSATKVNRNVPNPQLKPDVYFLVFDEYSSSVSLKQNYGYDNSSLDSFLISQGFFISQKSRSNYTYTVFSLASTLNLNYFKNARNLNFPDDFGLVWNCIYENQVFKTFKDEGYEIKNFSLFDINEHPARTQSFSRGWALRFVFDKSLYSAYMLLYLWIDHKHYTHLLEKKMSDLHDEFQSNTGRPKFMYIHFLLPHHPYIFDSIGAERSVFRNRNLGVDANSNYCNQLTFTNKVIKKVISNILLSHKKKIIILEGDHGNRFYNLPDASAKAKYFSDKNEFKNLNAYYFFDRNYSQLYDGVSPVNSFRVVFNQYFNKQYPLLSDSSVF